MIYDENYWNKRFENSKTVTVPEKFKKAIKRIYESYPKECMPQGICDPMYILNIIAKELGFGDGQNNFY